ncbi:MAG: bifunctional proline dehydrogenase/L-glutamate gamma-semialdehyde dehydrogenase [Actinomycetota bacterium]|nr:bifunctional proline dehydrogenase/L-glutamate gamma-semialdehyde dehydrogenase [Actinomycetota bacterium]
MSDDLTVAAERMAASLLHDAAARRRPAERRQATRLARLLGDPAGRAVILALTDEVLRIGPPARAAAVLTGLERRGANPIDDWRGAPYLGPVDRLAFVAGGRLAPWLPGLVVPAVRRRVKGEMSGVILPAGRSRLARHIHERRQKHMALNINVLGEAVLGEDEAQRRLGAVLEVLDRPAVDYVSVKISSICSQLEVLAFDHEVARIADRLRPLYRRAMSFRRPKFVNLDMEEYRDLDLTMAVFRRVLDEEEFLGLRAGIVLQAYLPDSYAALDDLAAWARIRRDRGGAPVKVRIVKGANLAMETVEAEIHGWPRAPFETKAATDASYKRILARCLTPDLDGAVLVGVASHNLFEVAWAATMAEAAGASDRVEFEMLEGMSPAVAEAVAERFGRLLLYAPIVGPDDLEAAIAYLVRRLDENSGEDNFLAHQFDMHLGSSVWARERDRFRRAVADAADGAPSSRRDQNRATEQPVAVPHPFVNEADTDFTRRVNREWAWSHVRRAGAEGLGEYRALVGGAPGGEPADQPGVDPGHPGRPAYRWAPASVETVGQAVAAARAGQDRWRSLGAAGRRAVLHGAAAGLARHRGRLLAAMAVDSGKTLREGDPEVSEAVDFARYYAEHVPADDSGFEPYGTVAVVSPWNFPLSIPAGGVLAALAAGNTVILKPAPETVAVAGELVQALWRAGVPHEALHFLPCVDGEASRQLIVSPGVDAVILTGSWETARMFLSWRPELELHAETSGKNAIVVTATADPDQAIADLVHSAFGHAGQKCSAASLAILEAPVHDDGRFLRRLADAVRSLRVGPADQPPSFMGPLIRPPEGPLADALSTLAPGESWLVAPERLDDAGYLWSPGVKTGVSPGSPFHLTECFGPVLGVMRAADLEQALVWQNQPAYGLTAGLQALDPLEIEHWRGQVQAGNLYVNRGITGAIVGRQPFGGWKRSVVGPGAKAGGPNYVASLGRWPRHPYGPGADRAAYEEAWRRLARPMDPSGLRAEANVFRYRPLRRVAVMGDDGAIRTAARVVGVDLRTVDSPEQAAGCDKLRLPGVTDPGTLRAAHEAGVWVDAAPVDADPAREILRWVREQAVSESRHRHGNITGRRPGLLPPP